MTPQVKKTYKLYIDGQFPRTESGKYKELKNRNNKFHANVCLASRKDFRNAVVAARAAQQAWQERSAYNKSQIIYRIAEMLQQKEALFVDEMMALGYSKAAASREFKTGVELLVYYTGWCDKFSQIYSSVNPVAGSYFNFSVPEPMGVVASIASNDSAVAGLIQALIPSIVGGNSIIVLASETYPTIAISFAEILATSDVPAGVVNILTGQRDELRHHFASHMDVNALIIWDSGSSEAIETGIHAAENLKRLRLYPKDKAVEGHPHFIMDLQEIKTTWHPVEHIAGSGSAY